MSSRVPLRAEARAGRFVGTTADHRAGFAQALRCDAQAVALASSPPWMLTHAPGSMLVLDLPNERLRS